MISESSPDGYITKFIQYVRIMDVDVRAIHCRKLLTLGRGRCGSVDCYRVVDQCGNGVETLHDVTYDCEDDTKRFNRTTTTASPVSIIANDAVIAIKSFNRGYNISKVLHELKVLESLQSKSVYLQQLLGCVRTDGGGQQSLLVLEAYLGGSLSHHILHNSYQHYQLNRFPIHCIRNVVSELVSALTVLECMDIIHRDVKTSNCLIDSSGRLKLCDFGSSKVLWRDSTSSSCAAGRTNTVTGTYHGVAPEVVACAAHDADVVVGYDHSVDYWGLGVLMYELLTGKMPAWIRRPVSLDKTTCDSVRDDDADDAFRSSWPDEHAGSVAREAIDGRDTKIGQGVDVIRLNAVSFVDSILGHASRDCDSDAASSRDTTTHNEIEGCWHIEAIDGRFACARADVALPELLFDPACRHSSVEEVHLCGAAVDLVRCLLTVNPDRRLETLKQKRRSSMRRGSRRMVEGDDDGRWSSVVRGHPFFDGSSWGSIDSGASTPSLVDYDRRLGFTDLIAAVDDPDELISPENQLLFGGF